MVGGIRSKNNLAMMGGQVVEDCKTRVAMN
jgi:hypothetical protein